MYKMVNKANGGEHFVNEEVYQKMKQRNHLKNYTVTEVPDSSKAGKYMPPEVKSMADMKKNQQTDAAAPGPGTKKQQSKKKSAEGPK